MLTSRRFSLQKRDEKVALSLGGRPVRVKKRRHFAFVALGGRYDIWEVSLAYAKNCDICRIITEGNSD